MALAKRLGSKPRDVAAQIVEALDVDDIVETPEVTGPGLRQPAGPGRRGWPRRSSSSGRVSAYRSSRGRSSPSTTPRPTWPRRCTSATCAPPSWATPWPARWSTSATRWCARTTSATGARRSGCSSSTCSTSGEDSPEAHALEARPNDFYQAARAKFDGDEAFATRARQRVVTLQAGDPDTLRALGRADRPVEGLLQPDLPAARRDADRRRPGRREHLQRRARRDLRRARGRRHRDDERGRAVRVPRRLHRSRGQAGAAHHPQERRRLRLRHHRPRDHQAPRPGPGRRPGALRRRGTPGAALPDGLGDRPQGGLAADDSVEVIHVQIGNVLGPDGKILRTRSGDPIRLMSLLEEAVERAEGVIAESRPDLDAETRSQIAWQVGIGAVKYADLSVSHDSEYTFDFERMLSLQGNTGPYLQYAAARIRSILRKATEAGHAPGPVVLGEEAERALGLTLLGFGDVVAAGRGHPGAAPALRLPLRAGAGLHGVLRELPGPQDRRRRRPRLPPRAVLAHPRGPRDRPRPARHPDPRPRCRPPARRRSRPRETAPRYARDGVPVRARDGARYARGVTPARARRRSCGARRQLCRPPR